MRELPVEVAAGATVDDAWAAAVARRARRSPRAAPRSGSRSTASTRTRTQPLADGDEIACIPPVERRRPDRRAEPDPASCARSRCRATSRPSSPTSSPPTRTAGVVTFVGRTRVTPGTPAPGQEAEAARHAGRVVEELEYEAFEPHGARRARRDRGRDRGAVRRRAARDRPPDRRACRWARRPSWSWPPRRTAARPSRRPATRSTRRRRGRRSGRPSGSRTGIVWIGDVARTGPEAPARAVRRRAPVRRPSRPLAARHTARMQLVGDGSTFEDLRARATDIASAWGATAAGSRRVGQERAILRLFGVTGLDRAGPAARGGGREPVPRAGSAAARRRHRPPVRDGAWPSTT